MKTAVSIPEPIFREGEKAAKRMRVSRSRLYSQALEFYLNANQGREIRKDLETVYGRDSFGLDPVLEALQADALREKW